VWSQYASALSEAERYSEAVDAFSRVIEIDPDFENAYIRRGLARLEAGQRQQALADLEQAAQRGGQQQVAQVLYREGANALQANRFDDAARLLEQASGYADTALRTQIAFF